jgi:ParB family chromosome partitioning protein
MPRRPELKGLGDKIFQSSRSEEKHPIENFTIDIDPNKILNLPVQSISPNPEQPRKHFDEEPLASLTASLKEQGLLQPVVVRKADDGDNGFVLIAGERRWRAAQAAGWKKIPALVRNDADPLELALIENLQRQDLNPLEEAEALLKLKKRRNLTDETLARIVGKRRSTITELLTLNHLEESIKRECRTSDKYTKSILLPVVRQSTPEDQLALWETIKGNQLSVQEARKVRKNKPLGRAKHHEFKYQPEGATFIVRVTFRKASISPEEIKHALQQALEHIEY